MSKTVIAIDPVTRLEGHLKVEVQVEDGKVADAWITGGMFRGFEAILRGRNPRDASQIVQRICGVCPVAHATASSLAIEAVCGVEVPENGRIARNLMLAGNYLQSNILHFYHLGGQDYFHGPDTVPFIPRYRNPDLRLSEEQNTLAMDEYIEALEVRQVCHQLVALFGGRMPHLQGILGGGAAQIPDRETILEYAARMKQVRKFVENRYLPLVYTSTGVTSRSTGTASLRMCVIRGLSPRLPARRSRSRNPIRRWTRRARTASSRPPCMPGIGSKSARWRACGSTTSRFRPLANGSLPICSASARRRSAR